MQLIRSTEFKAKKTIQLPKNKKRKTKQKSKVSNTFHSKNTLSTKREHKCQNTTH